MDSSNSEERFISSLLRASSQEQEIFFAKQIPVGVFKTHSTEMFWVSRYREKYRRYPSPSLYRSRFHESLPKHKDPIEACLQPVLDMAMYQAMLRVNQQVKKLLDADEPINKAMAVFKEGASQLKDFSVDYVDSDFSRSRGAIVRYKETVREISNPKNKIVDSPWPSLNKLIFRLRLGNSAILSARTSIGKTWIIVYWAEYLAEKGVPVLFVTKEMPTEQIEDRFEALRYGLPYTTFSRAELPPKILRKWQDARNRPNKSQLIICGDETLEGTGLEHVVAKIEQYRPRVVFIDGAYLLSLQGLPKNVSKVEKLGYLSSRIKLLAKFTKTIIIGTVQLNRTAEDKKGGTKGGIGSIYGADSWAQDSDFVFSIGGQRGAMTRVFAVDKGRDTNIGEFSVDFKLDPCPSFEENRGLKSKPKFVGIKI